MKHSPLSRNISYNDRGVSETVGFIIIFGIVMTGIALVTLYGYPLILQQQANTNIRNMEKNMIVLQSDVNHLIYKNVPYQETTLQVTGGTLTIEMPYSAEKYFMVHNSTDQLIPNFFQNNRFYPGQLLFISETGDRIIGLQNGAVVARQSSGSTMISEPRWFFDTTAPQNTLVLTFIQIDAPYSMSQTAFGNIKMKIEPLYPSQEILLPHEEVTIEYYDSKFDYFSAWRNYFNKFSPTTNQIVSIEDVDKIVLKFYKIQVLEL